MSPILETTDLQRHWGYASLFSCNSVLQVVYFTATFPYIVLIIFFFRGVTLDGFHHGLHHFFVPDVSFVSYLVYSYSQEQLPNGTTPPQKVFNLLTLSQMTNIDPSKLKEFADDNFKFYENGNKLSKWIENTFGKAEIPRYEQFLLFPQCFRKSCSADM